MQFFSIKLVGGGFVDLFVVVRKEFLVDYMMCEDLFVLLWNNKFDLERISKVDI